MKKLMMVAVAVLAANTRAATVTTGEVLSHDPWDGKFDVPYKLANVDLTAQYKVAFEITANGRTASVTNAACRLENKVYSQTLDTKALFGGVTTDRNAKAKVSLIAVRPRVVPNDLYMVIDLVNKNADGKFPVTFCSEGPDDAPNWNADEYKTNKIVLRKISSCKWYPCDPTTNADREGDITNAVPVYSDYWLSVFEVTGGQFAKVMSGPCTDDIMKKPTCQDYGYIRAMDEKTSNGGYFMKRLAEKCIDETGSPVLGFDLPTEAQWEIACRAGTLTKWCWGNEISAADEYAITVAPGRSDVVEVGTLKPNDWGFYDMHGNAAEWCRDKYGTPYAFEPTTAEAFFANEDSTEKRRVVRGGCMAVIPNYCASSYRVGRKGDGTDTTKDPIGFRVCRMAEN